MIVSKSIRIDNRAYDPILSLNIRMFAYSNKKMKQLMEDAFKEYVSDKSYCSIQSWSDRYWEEVHKKTKRRLDSVFLPREQKQRVLTDIKKFLENKQWYLNRGIPYKRGYLFYGPPGTGKSSFIHALASELNVTIFSVNLNSLLMTVFLIF